MSRSIVSGIALGVLIALTAASWTLAEGGASARWLAAIAVAKALVILAVFLELGRSWPGWAVIATLYLGIIAGGAAWLIGG